MECSKLIAGHFSWIINEAKTLSQLMTHYVILHGMIVDDEGERAACTHDFEKLRTHVRLPKQEAESISNLLEMHRQLRDQQVHMQLLNDLMEHMWVHAKN